MTRKTDGRAGFTLVEMVAVIVIIGILIGVVSTGLNSARENVWRTRARDTARQLVDAWNLFLLDYRGFPPRGELAAGAPPGGGPGIPATIKSVRPLRYEIESFDPLVFVKKDGKFKERSARYIELTFDEAYERGHGADEGEMSGVGAGGTEKSERKIALADHWNQPLYFELDFDMDGYCEAPGFIPSSQGGTAKDAGKDKKKGVTSKVKGNAVSWSHGPPSRKGKKWVAAWK